MLTYGSNLKQILQTSHPAEFQRAHEMVDTHVLEEDEDVEAREKAAAQEAKAAADKTAGDSPAPPAEEVAPPPAAEAEIAAVQEEATVAEVESSLDSSDSPAAGVQSADVAVGAVEEEKGSGDDAAPVAESVVDGEAAVE